jgi:tetratricopeptide (TPR) repeat protein
MLLGRIVTRELLVGALICMVCVTPASRAADDDAKLRKQALALNDVTGDMPIQGQVDALVAEPETAKKLLAFSAKMAKEKEQPFNYNGAFILAQTAQKLKDLDNSETFYRICVDQAAALKSGRKTGLAYAGLIDLYMANKKYAECEKICQEFLELADTDDSIKRLKPIVLRRQVQALARQDKVDDAMKLVDKLVKLNPTNWLTLELRGWVQREAGNYDAAVKTYEEVLSMVEKDKELDKEEKTEVANEYRYILSGVYVDANQIDKAAEQLQTLLKQDENNPTYNNDLGYIWADHDKNLDESEKLIRHAIEEERKLRKKLNPDAAPEDIKDNASYIDSLGWVLYKQKKYKEAVEYLLQATKDQEEGQHYEIYDHLGDAYQAVGKKTEALGAWKKAVELAGTEKRSQQRKGDIEKKIKANSP